jgi:Ca2+-transporting ATPase
MSVSNLTATKASVDEAIKTMSLEGYRLLAVAEAEFTGNDFPKTQQEYKFRFIGLLHFTILLRLTLKMYSKTFMQQVFQ